MKIGNLDSQLPTSPSADDFKEHLLLQTEFNLRTTQKAETLFIRSHHIYYEHDNKTGRILAHRLAKKQQARQSLRSGMNLRDSDSFESLRDDDLIK